MYNISSLISVHSNCIDNKGAAHLMKNFLEMMKIQLHQNSSFEELLLANLVHDVYIGSFFRFDTSLKSFFVSCYYHGLFVCLAAMILKVNSEII